MFTRSTSELLTRDGVKRAYGIADVEMENKAFSKGTETGTELENVIINGVVTKKTNTCTPEVCRSARQRFQPPDLANNSPWAKKKTYFFIGTIVLLLVWILIYTIVSELKLV